MPGWLGTGIVVALIALMVGAIVWSQLRARKQGKSGCSCGCEHCAMQCHQKKQDVSK